MIGTQFSARCREQLVRLLKDNMGVFAWQPSDMRGVPRRLIKHTLNVNYSVPPVAQKRRVLGTEKSRVVTREVEEWTKAGIVRPVKYPTWISNPVLVKKMDGTWRMCIDFKNLNSACPKYYYPLPEIDLKIEAVMGYPFKCFLEIIQGVDSINPIPKKTKDKDRHLYQPRNILRSVKMPIGMKNVVPHTDNAFLIFAFQQSWAKPGGESVWTEEAEHAFHELKKFILELPALTTPEPNETLCVYLATSRDAVSGVLIADRKGRQTPIRYVSRTLHEAERNYAPLDHATFALFLLYPARRLRLLLFPKGPPIQDITDQPIKQILSKPEASEKLAKYAVELGAYNIAYIPRTAVKGQVLADFINEVPKGVGAGLVLIDPHGTEYTYAIRLTFPSTNNEAEYEALLAGLRIARKMKVHALDVKVDSKLVACQMNGEFVASNEGMAKYLAKAKEQAALFKRFSIKNIPINQNQKVDVLSKLASVAFNHLTKEILVEVLNAKSVDGQEVNTIVEEEEDNWMTPIMKCFKEGVWPVDENKARALRMKIGQYVVEDGVLFKKSYLSPMLRCVGPLQANYIIREVHEEQRGAWRIPRGSKS
ncbi:reverse transcriptase domain-containing protein [Tanacetum coccineum]